MTVDKGVTPSRETHFQCNLTNGLSWFCNGLRMQRTQSGLTTESAPGYLAGQIQLRTQRGLWAESAPAAEGWRRWPPFGMN